MTPSSNLVAGVALDDEKFERAMKQATVRNEHAGNSSRGLPGPKGEFAQHHVATVEINISGSQVLVALIAAFSLAGPLLWTFVRYWLFAP
jgi:hypothetical protein